ncbi:MAG: tail fiber protein [Myxococcaceae bacterium]
MLDGGEISVANGGITSGLIGVGAVTNDKVPAGALSTDRLAAGQATAGDVLRHDGTNWAPSPETRWSAGAGLNLSGTTFSVDPAVVQASVTGNCAAGSSIRQINPDGSVICEPQRGAGAGLALSGNTLLVDGALVQSRVTGSCPGGQAIKGITIDGSVTCEPINSYSTGFGLTRTGNTFSADTNVLQRRITFPCSSGTMMTGVAADGTVACGQDGRFGGGLSSSVTPTTPTTGLPCTLGEVRLFAGNFPPQGSVFADGRRLSIASYTALFAILGTTYGGDGQTTFDLPDLRNAVPRSANGAPLQYVICLIGSFPPRN